MLFRVRQKADGQLTKSIELNPQIVKIRRTNISYYRSTQPCIPLGSLNRVPAIIGWGKGRNVTSSGWQVILCDPIWHVSSRSGVVLVAKTAIRFLPYSAESVIIENSY